MKNKKFTLVVGALVALSMATMVAAQDKPNIVFIWGDDIGQSDVSAYTMGLMGFQTPNIDRVAKEGMSFTDYYAEQSCTAGRSAFITGQSVFRTGLSKVGLPGAEEGMQPEDPTIAELLKPHGYATGQFGKNHLGDKDEMLPSNHGFDEFYGNLYHLNAEEEPEHLDYPKEADFPGFSERYGPRGVIHSFADGKIEAGSVSNEIMSHLDWMPTLLAAAGDHGRQGRAARGSCRPATRPSRCISTVTTSCRIPDRPDRRGAAKGVLLLLR